MDEERSDAVNPIEEMHTFIRYSMPKEFYASLVNGIMSEKTYDEWLNEYREHVGKMFGARDIATAGGEVTDEGERENEFGSLEDRLDSLFDMARDTSIEPIQQNITKFENGQLLKSPGEIGGDQVIRLNVYDIKNIAKKNKHNCRDTLNCEIAAAIAGRGSE